MKINAVKNLFMGTTLLAAAALSHSCTNNPQIAKSEDSKTFLTGAMSVSDIQQRQSARDNVALNLIDMFDANNDGMIDEAEAAVFNATDFEESGDDVVLKTNMKTGDSVVQRVDKKNKDNIKYIIESGRVVDWANIPQIKQNAQNDKYYNLDACLKNYNINSPAIVTMDYFGYTHFNGHQYDYEIETFANDKNQKTSTLRKLSNTIDEEKIIFNYNDSSRIESEYPVINPINPENAYDEESLKNNYEIRKYYTKESPDIAVKTEYYQNDSLKKTENQ